MLPNKKPCENCIHKKVCEATKKFDEINVTVTHPFFKAQIECTEFREGLVKKSESIYCEPNEMRKAVIENKNQ